MVLLGTFVLVVWLGAVVVAIWRHCTGRPPLQPKPPQFTSTKYKRDPRVPAWRGVDPNTPRLMNHVDPHSNIKRRPLS